MQLHSALRSKIISPSDQECPVLIMAVIVDNSDSKFASLFPFAHPVKLALCPCVSMSVAPLSTHIHTYFFLWTCVCGFDCDA